MRVEGLAAPNVVTQTAEHADEFFGKRIETAECFLVEPPLWRAMKA